ncbi:MAG: hypothetical protein K0M45_03745 [Candidatus Paracaedibacteraceae bacterium]|nr:hypothetical protein [Candidatus Paracaedibacteraceae bacterium]
MKKFFLLYGAFLAFVAITCMDITCSPKPPVMYGNRANKGWSNSAFSSRERREKKENEVIMSPVRQQRSLKAEENFVTTDYATNPHAIEQKKYGRP